jgi:hypothetical protein
LHGSLSSMLRGDAEAQAAAWRERWPPSALPEEREAMPVAQSQEELEAIGHLRYELYIARDGKAYAHADHARRCFLEPRTQSTRQAPALILIQETSAGVFSWTSAQR